MIMANAKEMKSGYDQDQRAKVLCSRSRSCISVSRFFSVGTRVSVYFVHSMICEIVIFQEKLNTVIHFIG